MMVTWIEGAKSITQIEQMDDRTPALVSSFDANAFNALSLGLLVSSGKLRRCFQVRGAGPGADLHKQASERRPRAAVPWNGRALRTAARPYRTTTTGVRHERL